MDLRDYQHIRMSGLDSEMAKIVKAKEREGFKGDCVIAGSCKK